MPSTVDIRIEPGDQAKISEALDYAFRCTKWSAEKAVVKASYYLARSASAASKGSGKTNREKTGDWKRPFGSIGGPAVRVLSQRAEPYDLLVASRSDPRIKIPHKGLAAASWRMLGKRISGKGAVGKEEPTARKWTWAKLQAKQLNPYAIMQNNLSYMLAAFPNVVHLAVVKGMASLVHEFDKDLATELKKKWA